MATLPRPFRIAMCSRLEININSLVDKHSVLLANGTLVVVFATIFNINKQSRKDNI